MQRGVQTGVKMKNLDRSGQRYLQGFIIRVLHIQRGAEVRGEGGRMLFAGVFMLSVLTRGAAVLRSAACYKRSAGTLRRFFRRSRRYRTTTACCQVRRSSGATVRRKKSGISRRKMACYEKRTYCFENKVVI